MPLSIGSERIVVVWIGRKAGTLGQFQKVSSLIDKNLDARSRNRRRAAGPAGEHQTERIDNYRRSAALARRRVVSGYISVVYQPGSLGNVSRKSSPKSDAMDFTGIHARQTSLDDFVLNRAFVAVERIR